MQDKTTEFSFILKPSKFGVGVFATHDIKAGAYLRLFDMGHNNTVLRGEKDIPEIFRGYCIERGEYISCPKDFGHMEIGWYLNHSKEPNAFHIDYNYFALRDILAGEEILIDYDTLEEPEEARKDYYKQ